MSLNFKSIYHAMGSVSSAGNPSRFAAGCAITRNGVGDYTVTLDDPADASQCSILCTGRGASNAQAFRVVHTSATQKQILALVGGVATDNDFDFMVFRAPR